MYDVNELPALPVYEWDRRKSGPFWTRSCRT